MVTKMVTSFPIRSDGGCREPIIRRMENHRPARPLGLGALAHPNGCHAMTVWLDRAGAVFAGASIAFALTGLLFPELLRWLL